ncbi:hypothetical protein [Mycobacterium syngnathidarum]|uniref:hypothetical protein n=1 Tax=Mycobacterium syngnathidarum TaxID=1908205 RepID=UPI001055DEA7|nr:hypothetical protein [Mycobacterium syngnathidarum]
MPAEKQLALREQEARGELCIVPRAQRSSPSVSLQVLYQLPRGTLREAMKPVSVSTPRRPPWSSIAATSSRSAPAGALIVLRVRPKQVLVIPTALFADPAPISLID